MRYGRRSCEATASQHRKIKNGYRYLDGSVRRHVETKLQNVNIIERAREYMG